MSRLPSILLLVTSALAAGAPPKLRLSEVQKVQPVRYRAELTIDPEKDDFIGSIVIQLDINEATSTIWLNQKHITVKSAVLLVNGKEEKATVKPGGEDFVGFAFNAPVPAGAAELRIGYSGAIITKNTAGLFRQKDGDNWYVYSQFEQIDARAAFPCFDEPSYKTPWQLTLHVPAKDSAISNTNPASEKTEGGMKTVVFHPTPPLPSYLVAVGVGPFEFIDAGKAGKAKIPVRIVIPKGHSAEAKYAAENTAIIITRHEQYFGTPYPYEKADQVAVPDFGGAMENPGMVTYAQNLLLAKPESDSINRQRSYILVAAHELAHQWFGDLVTTAWWDDIWLNEAFATWMEKKYLADFYPQWKSRVGDVTDKLDIEQNDSLVSARKIRQPIESNDDINNAFDGITYQKGGAVIGMFERWMGPAEFRKGVQHYMKQYAFKATTSGEFLDSLSTSSKKNVTKAFATFLNQAGVPLVSVSLKCEQGSPSLHLEQQRFLPLGSKGSTEQVWQIPVCVRYGSGEEAGTSQCTLLDQKQWT